nr:MAG TPA: hypothetical protein [Caudoviricetes sp.]
MLLICNLCIQYNTHSHISQVTSFSSVLKCILADLLGHNCRFQTPIRCNRLNVLQILLHQPIFLLNNRLQAKQSHSQAFLCLTQSRHSLPAL